MSRQPVNRKLFDDYGKEHSYVIVPLPAETAIDLHVEILEVIGAALDQTSGLSSGIRGVAELIARKGGAKLVRRVLGETIRDGVRVGGLTEDAGAHFAQAYQANIGEVYAAVAATLEVNFGPFFSSRVRGWFETRLPKAMSQLETYIAGLPIDSGSIGAFGAFGPPAAQPSRRSNENGPTST